MFVMRTFKKHLPFKVKHSSPRFEYDSNSNSKSIYSQHHRKSSHNNHQYDEYLIEAKKVFQEKYDQLNEKNGQLDDFQQIKTLGTGSFGRVVLVKHLSSETFFAMKIISKKKIMKLNQIEHILNEKRILQSLSFPFIVNLKYHFKDNSYLYMVLDYVPGGELFRLLHKSQRLTEEQTRFYAAQLVLVFEYLHYLDIVYRDLKPENVLIDAHGYLKLTDFGFAKKIKGRTWTLCGTPEYMSPEMILSKGYTKAVDWWSLGVLIYEMSFGMTPFHSKESIEMFRNIVSRRVEFPMNINDHLKDLIENLLEKDVTKRYGNLKTNLNDIKRHHWFENIQWLDVYQQKIRPSYRPQLKSADDTTYFDQYDEEPLPIAKTDMFQEEFKDF